ncbi:MAG: glycosyltransferase family 2 protein [Verrucomicrobiales bacterium]|nr:glycosyltransferase family 2 protein [Verrucomicrobiales bacterium]
MKASPQVTVSIATKDRPEDLAETLRQLKQFGLDEAPILILDDGSSPPISERHIDGLPNAKLLRLTEPHGQASGRNRIAREAETPYLLQLDDDSFPIEGKIDDIVSALDSEPDRIAIAIPMEEPSRNRPIPEQLLYKDSIEVKSFVGCSALLDRKKFLKVGGYAEWIGGWGEEEEFCIRALREGYKVTTSSALRIRHMASSSGRSLDDIRAKSVSHHMGIWIRHAPTLTAIRKIIGLLAFAILSDLRKGKLKTTSASVSSLLDMSHWKKRAPLEAEIMNHYLRLDHLLDFYPKITQDSDESGAN